MDNQNYLTEVLQEIQEGIGQFVTDYPEAGKKYKEFFSTCFSAGALSEKDKHLIAIGISIYAQDDYGLILHTEAALQYGATKEEIIEVIAVSASFGRSTLISQATILVQDVLEKRKQNKGQDQKTNQAQTQNQTQSQTQAQSENQDQSQSQDQNQSRKKSRRKRQLSSQNGSQAEQSSQGQNQNQGNSNNAQTQNQDVEQLLNDLFS